MQAAFKIHLFATPPGRPAYAKSSGCLDGWWAIEVPPVMLGPLRGTGDPLALAMTIIFLPTTGILGIQSFNSQGSRESVAKYEPESTLIKPLDFINHSNWSSRVDSTTSNPTRMVMLTTFPSKSSSRDRTSTASIQTTHDGDNGHYNVLFEILYSKPRVGWNRRLPGVCDHHFNATHSSLTRQRWRKPTLASWRFHGCTSPPPPYRDRRKRSLCGSRRSMPVAC